MVSRQLWANCLSSLHQSATNLLYEETGNREKMFKFSSLSIARLKAQARNESGNNHISSLQALTALVWRAITRAKGLTDDQVINCTLVANYFGNCICFIRNKVRTKDLLEHDLGRAASLLNQAVGNRDDWSFRNSVARWLNSRSVFQSANGYDSNSLMITHSPRLDMYGNEFGLGKAIAVRSGYAYKFGGVVAAYPGCHGEGCIDLEICLRANTMIVFQTDEEFIQAVSE